MGEGVYGKFRLCPFTVCMKLSSFIRKLGNITSIGLHQQLISALIIVSAISQYLRPSLFGGGSYSSPQRGEVGRGAGRYDDRGAKYRLLLFLKDIICGRNNF
jgi:hypothetical protein